MANAPRFIAGLVRAGAEVDARDNNDLTPLHLAAAANAPAAIGALVKAGANLEAVSRFKAVPLDYALHAASIPPVDAVMALLDAGANPNGLPERAGAPLKFCGIQSEYRTRIFPVGIYGDPGRAAGCGR